MREWTEREIKILLTRFPYASDIDLMRLLDRKWSEIVEMAKKLGIKHLRPRSPYDGRFYCSRCREYKTPDEVALVKGVYRCKECGSKVRKPTLQSYRRRRQREKINLLVKKGDLKARY